MRTIIYSVELLKEQIPIGIAQENDVTEIWFDCTSFINLYGDGTAEVIHRRPKEVTGYHCEDVRKEGNYVIWNINNDDTAIAGVGQAQIRWYVGEKLRESIIVETAILPAITSAEDPPAEVKSALDLILQYVNDNTISIEDLDERIANYFDEHPIPTPVTSVNEKLGDVVLTAEDVGAYSAEEADEKFCVPDGEYEELNAGTAKQLLSNSYTLDQVPYLYRKSPDSDRAVEEIVGGTVGWNQLVQNGHFDSNYATYWNVYSGTGSVSNSVLTVADAVGRNGVKLRNYIKPLITNHIYLIDFWYMSTVKLEMYLVEAFTLSSQTAMTRHSMITKRTRTIETDYSVCDIFPSVAGQQGTFSLKDIQVTDLTTMFGTTIADYIYSLEQATAGSGVAKLKEWGFFTEDHYEYCEPTLRSVEGLVSKKTVGFNQWDEEWEVGDIDRTTGQNNYSTTQIRSKNYIHVLPNTQYYIKADVSNDSNLAIIYYDSEKNFISSLCGINIIRTTPNNCCYMRFVSNGNYGKVYNHDICINLSDPTKNGTYEPYESHTYSLDSEVVLRGIPKLDSNNNLYYDGDVYPSDGNGSRRYGLLTLDGSSDETFLSGMSGMQFGITISDMYVEDKYLFDLTDIMCDKLTQVMQASNWGVNYTFSRIGTDKRILFKFGDDITTEAQLRTYLASNPITFLYRLATPTTFTAQPYHNPQIVGDTEEWVTTGIVPVGHSTKYYQNLRKKIEGLPWNFSSLIAPTEVTNKATRNYTAGSYLILNNTLYKVTANIANGGTITPNTNVTATTIMAEIMAL